METLPQLFLVLIKMQIMVHFWSWWSQNHTWRAVLGSQCCGSLESGEIIADCNYQGKRVKGGFGLGLEGRKCLNSYKEGENSFLMGEMPRTKAER